MTHYILTYFEEGDKHERIHHREVYPTILSAKLHKWLSERNPRRSYVRLTKEEVSL